MKISTAQFRTVDPAQAPVVLEWEFGTRPGKVPPGTPRTPLVHAYRNIDGVLHEAAAPHHDWFSVLREGDDVADDLPGLDRAILINGGLWRPSTGPVFFPFASLFDTFEDQEAELRYASTVVMSTNYRPDIALGPLFCFSVLDSAGNAAILAEAIDRPDLGPTAGSIVFKGDVPDLAAALLRENTRSLFGYVLDQCAAGRLGTETREDLAAIVTLRRLVSRVTDSEPLPTQEVLDAIPSIQRLVSARLGDVEAARERPRRTRAQIRNLHRSQDAVWLRQVGDALTMLRLQCESQLDARNELAGLKL